MSFERREVLRRLGILAAAVPVTALFPEAALGRPQAGRLGKLRAVQLIGDEARRSGDAARRDPAAAAAWRHVGGQGLIPVETEMMVVRYQDEAGEAIGDSVLTVFRGRDRAAQLIQHRKGTETKAALAMWDTADPTVREIYRLSDGRVTRLGSVRATAAEVIVEDGERTIRIPRQRDGKPKAGALAAISDARSNMTSDCREVCGWIVGMHCNLTCDYSFMVICTIMLGLTGLPGLACFLVSFGTCFWGCNEWQQWACQTLCS